MKIKIATMTTSVLLHIYLGVSILMAMAITKKKKTVDKINNVQPYQKHQPYMD